MQNKKHIIPKHAHNVAGLTSLVIGTVLLLSSLVTLNPQNVRATATYSWQSSGLDGANFQNVIALDSANSTILTGSDLAGIHRSTNYGQSFAGAEVGLTSFGTASLLFDPRGNNKAYAATGSGFYISSDNGATWTSGSSSLQYSTTTDPNWPALGRGVGKLIAVDQANGTLWTGTLNGVYRSTNGGTTWTQLGMNGIAVRGLAVDPSNINTMYFATSGDKIYKTTVAETCTAGVNCTFTALANSPTSTEEILTFSGNVVYAAAGTAGVSRSANGGSTWSGVNNGLQINSNNLWDAIDGFDTGGGNYTIYVGAQKTGLLYKTTDGVHWSSAVAPSGIHNDMVGAGGKIWWESASNPSFMLGGSSFSITQLIVDPNDTNKIILAGKSGLWYSSDAGANWNPMVHGLDVAQSLAIVEDPNVPGRFYGGTGDFNFLYSTDNMASVNSINLGAGGNVIKIALDASTTPSTVYVVSGSDTSQNWNVYFNTDPVANCTVGTTCIWSKLDLNSLVGNVGISGLAVKKISGSAVVLAAVQGSGIWRYSAGSWSQVLVDSSISQGDAVWPTNSSVAYYFDKTSGLWRGTNNGTNWTQVWNKGATSNAGAIAFDPNQTNRLYLSVGGSGEGLYRADNADSGTVTPQKVKTTNFASAVTVDSTSTVWLTEKLNNSTAAKVSYSSDQGSNWFSADDTFYQGSAAKPVGIVVGSDHRVYVASSSGGAIIGTSSDTTSPTVDITAPANGATVAGTTTITANASDDVGVTNVEFYRDSSTLLGSDNTAPYTFDWDTTAVANGAHTLTAKAYDGAGNVGTSTAVNVTVTNITGHPVVSLTAPDPNTTVNGTVSVDATASDAGATITKVDFYVDGVNKQTDTTSPYSFSWDTTGETDGTHSLYAIATDDQSQTGTSTTVDVIVDNTAPTVSITTPSNGATVSGTITIAATASDAITVSKVEFYLDGSLLSTDTSSPYTYSWDTTSVADGSHALTAKAYDGDGGHVTTSSTVTVTVSNPITVNITAPANNAILAGTFNVTASASGGTNVFNKVDFYIDSSLVSTDTTSPYSFSWDTTAETDGSHTIYAIATASNAQTGTSPTVNVTVDNNAPTVSISSPADGSAVSGTTTVTATASDAVGVSRVEFYIDGAFVGVDNSSPYTYSWDTTVETDGSHTIYAIAYDTSDHSTTSSTNTVTVDNSAPTVSITAPTASVTVNGSVAVTATASDAVTVSKVEFYVDGNLEATDTTSPYSFSWDTTAETDGSHTLTAKAYDGDGGHVTTSSAIALTVDNNPPTVSITAPTNGANLSATVSVSATASDAVTVSKVEFYVNGVLGHSDSTSPYSFAWDTTQFGNANYNLTAKAYDGDGGHVTTSSTVTVSVDNPLSVVIVAPGDSDTVSGTTTIVALPSGGTGVLSQIAFYIDGSLVKSDLASPYTYAWDTTAETNADHTIYAVATDSDSTTATSSTISVTVDNSQGGGSGTPAGGTGSSQGSGSSSSGGSSSGSSGGGSGTTKAGGGSGQVQSSPLASGNAGLVLEIIIGFLSLLLLILIPFLIRRWLASRAGWLQDAVSYNPIYTPAVPRPVSNWQPVSSNPGPAIASSFQTEVVNN